MDSNINFRNAMLQQTFIALIWGGGWIAGHVVTNEIPALAAAGWQMVIVVLSLGYLVLKEYKCFPRISKNSLMLISVMGFFGIFGYNICFLYGLKYILPGRAALIVSLSPICIAIGASLWMKEKMTLKTISGILIGAIGCLIVLAKGNPLAILQGGIGKGECIILVAVLLWTLYTLIGKCIGKTVPVLIITFYASVIGCLLLWILGISEGSLRVFPHFSIKVYACLMYLGVLGSGLCYVWYANGLKVLGATRAAAFTNLVPVSAVILSSLILHEQFVFMTLLGGALVLMGVTITNFNNQITLIDSLPHQKAELN